VARLELGSGGVSVAQRGSTSEQRGWNGHPPGRRIMLGGAPWIDVSRSRPEPVTGSDASSPRV
jgi:hypothetical protein